MTTLYWVGETDTSFSSGANWSMTSGGSAAGVAPGANDTLIFDSNSTKNCDLDATNPTISILKVESGFSYQLISSSSQIITVRQYIEVNQAGCFGFTSGNIITFSFNKAGAAISAYDGAGSAYTAGDIFVKYGANASVFADSTARSNCVYDFSADQNVVLVDGVYPNIISEGILYAKYITADSSATAFNTYGSVDILQYRTNGNGTVRSTSHDIYDYDKEFFFESIHSSGIGEYFQFGHTTARFKSGSANFRLPVLGDVYTNFGNNTTNTFNVQYHKIVIEAGDDSAYYCYIQPGKTLDCNELVIRDGGRLYGPAEGNQVASAKIKSVKRPTVQGDWNFKQIADGIYESIDNIPTLPVTEGGTGLNTVPVNSLLIGQGQLPLSTLSLGSAGDVLAVNGAGNAIEWSSTGGTNIELDELSDVTITSPEELQVLIYDGSGWVNGWPEVKMIQVRNDSVAEGSAYTIPAGAPLYSRGEIGGSNRIKVGIADANDPAKMPCIGVAYEEMNTSSTKDNYGVVSGVYNTNLTGFTGLSEGDTVYVKNWTGTPSAVSDVLTTTKPTGPTELIQNVGIILKTNGTIIQGLLVSAIGRTNDVPNTIDIEGDITSNGNISAKDGNIIGNTFIAGYAAGDAIFRTYNTGDHLELQTYDAGTAAFVTELEILNDQGGIQITNDVTSSGDLTLDRGSATSSLTRTLTIGGARNATSGVFAEIDFKNYDSDDGASDYSAAKIRVFNSPSGDDDGTIAFYTANNGTLATSPALSITDTGFVRVGPSGDYVAPLTVSQNRTSTGPSGLAQLVVKPHATSGQDASIEVRGARNSSTTAVPTSIKFTNYDSDLSGSNILGAIIGKVTNTSTNIGNLIFQTSADGSALSDRLTITSAGDVTIANDLTVQGDFTVSGTTTSVDTTNLNITDNIITLNDGETGAGVSLGTAGIEIDRGTATNATLLYDESLDGFVVDSKGTGRTAKFVNQNGYIELGPQNTSYAHITTDRTRFYFNRDLVIGENAISSYNGDFSVRRAQSTDEQIVIADNSMTFTSAGNDVVTIDGTNARFGIGEATPDNKLHVNSGGSNGVAKFESTDNMASIAIADNDTTIYVVSETNYGSFGGTNDLAATNLNIHKTTGDVGIGTTSPSFTSGGGLEIEHATQANLRVTDSTASASSDFGQSENDLYIVNRKTNGDIKIRVNSSNELMTFDGGNQTVLMGATSMGDNESKVGISGKLRVGDIANTQDGSGRAYLHVDSGTEDPGGTSGDFVRLSTLMMDGGSGGNNVMYSTYALRNETGTSWTTLSIVDGVRVDTDSEVLKADGVTGSLLRMWHEIDPMAQKRHWGHINEIGMTYHHTSGGRLGIGTTSPNEALHIRSASDHPLVLENTTNAAYVGIQFSDNSSNSYGQKGELRFNHADGSSEGSGASFHFTTTESELSIVGGKFISASGSVSEPGFAFSGDYDNGMFRPATNEIAFTTAGSEALRIDSSGDIGIGTDNPGEKLHVSGGNINLDAGYRYGFRDRGDLGIKEDNYTLVLMAPEQVEVLIDSNNNNTDDSNSAYFTVRKNSSSLSASTELFRVNEAGRVGIGTNDPQKMLHVKKENEPTILIQKSESGEQYPRAIVQSDVDVYTAFVNGATSVGSTSITVDGSGASNFASSGRAELRSTQDSFTYTGKTDNGDGTFTLTGIPSSGDDSIQIAIDDNADILNHPETFTIDGGYGQSGMPTSGTYYVHRTNDSFTGNFSYDSGTGIGTFTNVVGLRESLFDGDIIDSDSPTVGVLAFMGNDQSGSGGRIGTSISTVATSAFGNYRLDLNAGSYLKKNYYQAHEFNYSHETIPRMSILDGGNVGIGTTTPSYLLDVAGNARFGTTGVSGNIYLSADAAGSYIGWNASGTDVTLAADDDLILHADDDIFFQAGGGTKMTLLNTGELGIGTTTPDAPLHVKHTGNGDTLILESTDAAGVNDDMAPNLVLTRNGTPSQSTNTDAGRIQFKALDFTTSAIELLGQIQSEFNTADSSARMRFNVSSSGGSGHNDYEYMRFDGGIRDVIFNESGIDIDVRIEGDSDTALFFTDASSDRVGIGTTSPEAKLEIEQTTTTGHALKVYRNQSSSNMDSSLVFLHDDSQYADEVTLHVKQDGTGYAGIFEGGNVGIGTTSPASELDLNTGALSFANTNTQLKMTNSNTDLQLTHWGNAHIIVDSDGNDSNRYFSVRHGDTTASSATELFRVQEDGKVGIGETSPTFPLHIKYTDNRTDPEGSGSASGAGAIGADAEGSGLYIENASTTDGAWSGITFRTDTADARIAYQSVGTGLINEGQMSFFLDANDTGGNQLILEEVLRLRGGGSGAAQTFNSAYINGRLGIGTSSPDSALEIMNGTLKITREETESSVVTEDTVLLDIDGGLRWTFSTAFDNPNPVPIGTTTDQDIRIMRYNQTHTRWYWDRTYFAKKVGIGTTTVDSLLHVRGADAILTVEDTSIGISALNIDMAGIDLISGGMNSGNSKYGTALKFLSSDAQLTTENPKFLAAIAPRATEQYGADIDGGMALDFAVTDNEPGTTNVPVVRMTIDHTGNVGIGTTDPSGNLHVVGATGDSGRIYLNDADNGTGTGDALLINKSGTNAFIYNRDSGDLRLGSNNNSGYVSIKSDGDVGIGTSSPESRLEVVAALNPSSATQFTYAEVLKLDVENSGTAEGPAVRFRTGATNDHNAADYMFQVNGDGGGSSAHEYSFNWGYNKWYHVSGADGFKPIINLSYGGSSSAGQTQYGVINLVSTATAWDVYDGTHTGLSPTTYDNNVRISAGGDSYFNGGNLGIGVTSPVSTLDIGASGALSLGNVRTQLKITNSSADLQLGHADNVHILIDTFNNSTGNYFSVRKNSTTASSATELFRVNENGKIKFNDAYDFPNAAGSTGDLLTLQGNEVQFTTQDRITKPAVFMDTGTQNITQVETTVGFNSEILDGGNNAALSGVNDGHIQLTAGGYYRISYSIPINDDSSSAADRTRVFCFMQTDDNDAFSSPTTVAQSRSQVYTRENSGGSGLSTSFIYEHTGEDYIRLRIDAQNNTDISTESNQAQISIDYLGPA